uniref:Nucleocapsid protein n=1 Tax=Coleopteran orthomyxo-related virus OKIAV158 TaxID=2746261 RepID=A0A7D7F868_9ORTO|nr:nucleocapsid protein [Coleopteran orthomyxo-related virus OKIAV158]
MATQPSTRLIDPDDGSEINTAKKARYELQPHIKDIVLRFITLSHYIFYCQLIPSGNPSLLNISIGTQIMNIVFTIYTVCRQEGSSIPSSMTAKITQGNPKWTHLGQSYNADVKTLIQAMKVCAEVCGLSFNKSSASQPPSGSSSTSTDDPMTGLITGDKWFGVAGPFLNFLTGFSLRLKELRLGHSEFPFKKSRGQSISYPTSRYGLNRTHHILLEGIRFPPERRSSMVQTLGPMTNLLCYLEAPPDYSNKFEAAVKNSLGHIPNIEGIVKALKSQKKMSYRNIISLIADITIIVTSRQHNRTFPFPSAVTLNMVSEADIKKFKTIACPQPEVQFPKVLRESESSKWRQNITMSGLPAAIFYNHIAKTQWDLNGTFSSDEASQVIFHCWWGTYKEDLGILQSITTNQIWRKRDELGNKFQKMNSTSSITSQINLIKLTKFAKLASANQTGLMTQGAKQTASVPVFGGNRKRKFSDDFFKYLEEQSPSGTGLLTLQGIESDLTLILRDLKQKLSSNQKIQDAGTVEWIDMASSSSEEHYTKREEPEYLPNFRPNETCDYFLG